MNIKKLFGGRTARIILVCVAALVLLLAVWKVFFGGKTENESYRPTEQEERLCLILSRIEGVKGATVMISENGGAAVGAVIVFEGADSILTRMRVLEVTSNALNIGKEYILVYPAES